MVANGYPAPDVSVRDYRWGDETAIRAVMEAAYRTDQMPGWTHAEMDVEISRIPVDPDETLIAEEDGVVVGYWARRFDDLRVHPDHRRRGHGRRLFEAALARTAARGEGALTLHVPTHLPASVAFAHAVGLAYRSSLWQLRLPADAPARGPVIPDDVVLRSWPSILDVDAFVVFANAAWEGHPTPLGLTPELARLVAELPSFDPAGICLVDEHPNPGRPIAFAKAEIRIDDAGDPMGWIGQIAVLPAYRGRGLGRMLLEWSIAYLRGRGARDIDLAVEAANERALGLYVRTGFAPVVAWQHWVRPVAGLAMSGGGSSGDLKAARR